MEKPLQELKKIGHLIHLMVEKRPRREEVEFSAGPQGQVLRFLITHREKKRKSDLDSGCCWELHISNPWPVA